MTGRTHLLVGIAIGLAVAAAQTEIGLVSAAALAGGLGGLLPDIDHPRSLISGYVPGSGVLRLAISHRGPTHTILFITLFTALWMASPIPQTTTLAFAAGMTLHLLCDMATPAGVRLAWPLHRKSWRILPYEVLHMGSWLIEDLTVSVAVAGIMFAIIKRI
jgi:inner membrane protein